MSTGKTQIACRPDGPYLLKNDPVSLCIQKPEGDSVESVSAVALCRCGGSSNKPFCDGTHKKIGFSDQKLSDGAQDRRESYIGKSITIHDNRGICAHAGYCTDQLKSVFKMGEEPWIDPDAATTEDIISLIERCPSGALSYSIDQASPQEHNLEARITVIKDGPYAVSGDIELVGHTPGNGASWERYTLCRCGSSSNKPFCDGSHWNIGFKDDGD